MPPPSATEVLARARCLAASIRRLWLELAWRETAEGDRGQWAQSHRAILGELRDQRALPALTKAERRLLEKPAGRLSEADRLNAGWSTEGLGVLAWALGRVEALPGYDEMFEIEALEAFLQAPSGNTLRAAEVLGRARDEAERWHWRSNQTQGYFRIPGTQSGPMEMPLDEEQRAKQVRRALGEEVSLYGKAYPRLTGREFSLHRSIAIERHRALRWLCDGGEWDAEVLEPILAAPSEPSAPLRPRTGGIEELLAGLDEDFEAHFAEGSFDASRVERGVELLVRGGRITTYEQGAKRFGAGTRAEAFLAAWCEAHPDALSGLFAKLTAPRLRKAILRRALRLGWFDRIEALLRGISPRQLVTQVPFDELDRVREEHLSAAAATCERLGLWHGVRFRDAARRGDRATLDRWAEEVARLDANDFNGGFARRTLMPWALESLVTEAARAGLVETAHRALELSDPAVLDSSDGRALFAEVARAAALAGDGELARRLRERCERTERVDAALRVRDARSIDEVLRALPAPVTGYRLWSEVWKLVLERQGPSAAWEVLERAWARREERPRDSGELAESGLLLGWLELDTDELVRALCDTGAYEEAVERTDRLRVRRPRREATDDRRRIAYAAAVAGDRAVARKLCESIGGVVRFAPLLVEDWTTATMPAGGTEDDRLWWTIFQLEAHLGRSAALRDGFGLRR